MIRSGIKQNKEEDDEESSERWRISCDGAKNR